MAGPSCWPVVTSRSRWVFRCWPSWRTCPLRRRCPHSIPAPGLGALAAGRGGNDSQLARSLAKLGVGPDDIAVVSKHDTSTLANDPNETELHERLADSLGRSAGAPAVRRLRQKKPDRSLEGWRGGIPDDGAVPGSA